MNIKIFINIIIFTLLINSNLNAQTVFFDSKNIKIEKNGNMVFASKGVAEIPSKNLKIEGDKFVYDRENFQLTIFDNVKYIDTENDIIIESQKMIFSELENKLLSQSETNIAYKKNYKIKTSNISYNINSKKILSKDYTEVSDNFDNIFLFSEGLIFDLFKEIISSKKISIKDQNNNKYFFENSKINLKQNEIAGKELKIDFEDSFFGNENNDPVLKGSSIISNERNTRIFKTVFSTCNITAKNCRGWELQSEIFTHDKIKNYLNMKNLG